MPLLADQQNHVHHVCADSGYCLEDLPLVMVYRDSWRERESLENPCCSILWHILICRLFKVKPDYTNTYTHTHMYIIYSYVSFVFVFVSDL